VGAQRQQQQQAQQQQAQQQQHQQVHTRYLQRLVPLLLGGCTMLETALEETWPAAVSAVVTPCCPPLFPATPKLLLHTFGHLTTAASQTPPQAQPHLRCTRPL
jgi:hypothetical protein